MQISSVSISFIVISMDSSRPPSGYPSTHFPKFWLSLFSHPWYLLGPHPIQLRPPLLSSALQHHSPPGLPQTHDKGLQNLENVVGVDELGRRRGLLLLRLPIHKAPLLLCSEIQWLLQWGHRCQEPVWTKMQGKLWLEACKHECMKTARKKKNGENVYRKLQKFWKRKMQTFTQRKRK